ncbi:MAG TPA: hypothetical protein QF624_00070 [Dehalococcoidia bacterium]|nr:hypothetical protein [Dehalococcoidia bacterium]
MRYVNVRGSIVVMLLILVSAVGGFAGGFVYSHEPQPSAVELNVTSGKVVNPESYIAGTITSVDDSQITIVTDTDRTVTVDINSGTPVEQMLAIDPAELEIGTPVNLGGNLAAEGQILTGVVALLTPDGAPQ